MVQHYRTNKTLASRITSTEVMDEENMNLSNEVNWIFDWHDFDSTAQGNMVRRLTEAEPPPGFPYSHNKTPMADRLDALVNHQHERRAMSRDIGQ